MQIYQIYYREAQRASLDPLAIPFDNAGVSDKLLEFGVFERIARDISPEGLWGAVSWKFTEKTGLTLAELNTFVAEHPGADVYYCNPFPDNEALYHNLWQQGEVCHPDFLALCREFFTAAGLELAALDAVQASRLFSATNYHVGTPRFWKSYLGFIRNTVDRAQANLPAAVWGRLTSAEADAKGAHAGACYLPFIVERLFSYWLTYVAPKAGLTAVKYPVKQTKPEPSDFLVLRALKDRAVAERSNLLAVSWMKYRALFLGEYHSKAWVHAYIPRITPTSLIFQA